MRQAAAVFLAVQAVFLMCLLIYYHKSASPVMLCAGLIWILASLGMAVGLVRLRFLNAGMTSPLKENPGANNAHIFGVPGKNLDLAGICSILQEGVALLKHGHIIYINPALAYILAAQEEEILGTRISAYVHPEDTSLINLDGASLSRSTLRLSTRLGDVRWVICSIHNVDWQGEDAVLMLFENIGPLRQTQQALEELEQQSRILLERTPLGIAMFDSMGQLRLSNTAWNAIWSSIVGNSGRRFNILQDPFLPNTVVERSITQAFDKKDTHINNFEHTAPWGETRWLNLSFHPMTNPLGKLIGVSMIQQDITDQVRSARRENELNEQLTSLRNEISSYEAMLLHMQSRDEHVTINFEQDGSIAGWNRHAEKRFGLPADKAVGMHYERPDVGLSPYVPIIQEALSSNRPHTFERFERYDKSGPHYEKIMVHSLRAGSKTLVSLKIKDITACVFSETMRVILGRLDAISGVGRALDEVMDFSGSRPVLKPGAGDVEKFSELAEYLKFMSAQEWPSTNKLSTSMGRLLNLVEDKLSNHAPNGLRLSKEYSDESLEIFTDPDLAASAIAGLGCVLLSLSGDGPPELSIYQTGDNLHAIITIQIAAPDKHGLTDLPGFSAGRDEQNFALEEGPHGKSILMALRNIAACDGIAGGYSACGASGFVCRFPLPHAEP